MKRKLVSFLCFSILSTILIAQNSIGFRSVNFPSTDAVVDLKFIDANRGVAVTYDKIYVTNDAGENWVLKFSTPNTSYLSKINSKGDSVIVTGFYGTTGPSNISFLFNATTFQLVNIPNTYNFAYTAPYFFNDSMWTNQGNTPRYGLLVIKDAAYRVLDTNICVLNIYEDRISFFNGTHLKYSVDSAKTWSTVANLPLTTISQSYYDGNNTIYVQNQGGFGNQYEDPVFISHNQGVSWMRLNSNFTTVPYRMHFVDSNIIVGVDKNEFYHSINGGASFSITPFDSTSLGSKLRVHSIGRYFIMRNSGGLLVTGNNIPTTTSENKIQKLAVKITPNPSSGIVKLTIEGDNLDKLQLFDITGKLIFETDQFQPKYDFSSYPKGVYFISILSQGKTAIHKLILTD